MKNILTAATTALLFLFASAGCDDKNSDDTSEVVAPVDTTDVESTDQELIQLYRKMLLRLPMQHLKQRQM